MFGRKACSIVRLVALYAFVDIDADAFAQSRERGGKGASRDRVAQRAPSPPQRSERAPTPHFAQPRPTTIDKARPSREPSYSRPTNSPSPRPSAVRTAPPARSSSVDRSPRPAPARVQPNPAFSREPLRRVPESRAGDVNKFKDRVAPSPQSDGRSVYSDRPRYTVPAPQNDYRTDLRRHDTAGLIHIGADPLHVRIGDGHHGYHPRRYHYRPYCASYGPRHYYYGYRPLWYSGYDYYPSYLGYAYSSVYFTEPYVVNVNTNSGDPVVYDQGTPIYQQAPTVESAAPPSPAPAAEGGAFPSPTMEDYQATQPSGMPAIVSEGNKAFTAGLYEDARRAYLRAVLADERDGYAKVLLGWTGFAMGDFDGAAAAIRRALLTTPDLVDYPMDLRTLYSDQAVIDLQIDALVQWVQVRPDPREAEFVLAYVYYSVGQAQRAADIFNNLAHRDAKDTLAAQMRDAALRAAKGETRPPTTPVNP